MTEVRVTYDQQGDAAYIYLVDPVQAAAEGGVKSAYMYACDHNDVDGTINLDFDKEDKVVGIEVLDASTKLPRYLLDTAERLDA